MKTIIKIFSIALCLLMILSPILLADSPSNLVQPDINSTESIQNAGNVIIGVIKVVGIFVSVGVLMWVGIKYMMAGAEERAEYKKIIVPYIIGAVLLFSASVLIDKIAAFAKGLF